MAIDNSHFLELIYHWKQDFQGSTFKVVDAWYDKHYAPDAHKNVYAVLSIWTTYLESIELISAHEVLDGCAPGKWWYPFFPDLDEETNAKLPYRILAMYLSKLRNTKVTAIPGFREYVDSLKS
jgi:hypothetical protein